MSNWGKEELSLGSYSFYGVNSGPEDCKEMLKPVDSKLFFAGEAFES